MARLDLNRCFPEVAAAKRAARDSLKINGAYPSYAEVAGEYEDLATGRLPEASPSEPEQVPEPQDDKVPRRIVVRVKDPNKPEL